MTALLNLTDLTRDRQGWPAELIPVLDDHGEWDGEFDYPDNEHAGEMYIECTSFGMDAAPLFAKLIASEHNSTPTLSSIVLAALDFRDAFSAWRTAVDRLTAIDSSQALAAVRSSRADGIEAQRRLFEALKVVRR